MSPVWDPEYVEMGMVRLRKIVRFYFFAGSEANVNNVPLVFKVSYKIPYIAEEDNRVIIK